MLAIAIETPADVYVYGVIYASLLLGLPAVLFALWRVRRGVADAGWIGFPARLFGGAAAVAAIGYLLAWAIAPGVEVQIAECEAKRVIGSFCEDQGIAVAIPMLAGFALAPVWALGVLVMKLAVIAWRRGGRAAEPANSH